MPLPDPPERPPQIASFVAEEGFTDGPFDARQDRDVRLVDRHALALALELPARLGLVELLATPRSAEAIAREAGFVAAFAPALAWLLDHLAQEGHLAAEGAPGPARTYALTAPLPDPGTAALRAAALAEFPESRPSYDLLDAAAEQYPAIARGKVTAEAALFGRPARWRAYFGNGNRPYALSNRVAALAAARRLAGRRVLEVGAGFGSGTEALIEAVLEREAWSPIEGAAPLEILATELVGFFRAEAERALAPRYAAAGSRVSLRFAPLDISAPWAAQGIEPGSRDLVFAVNVLHVAPDLPAALREAHDALVPGGWLVLGECVRPAPERTVPVELVFRLLSSYARGGGPELPRAQPGFLTAPAWRDLLERAGFVDVALSPDVERIQPEHPTFTVAAIVGRRAPARVAHRGGLSSTSSATSP